MLNQRFAALGLLDLAGALQQRFKVAVFVQQLGRGLDADPRHARHIVCRIACEGLYVDHLVRRYAELFHHFCGPDLFVLDRVHHLDARPDELHQVLVGGDDRAGTAGLNSHPGIGRDKIVGLVVFKLTAGQAKGLGRFTDERELRDQVLRRLRPVGLVLVVDLVAEGRAPGIEDHGDMVDFRIVEKLRQHSGKAEDCVDRRAVRPRHRRKRMIGAEQVARAVDQVEMPDRLVLVGGGLLRGGRGSFGFRHAQGVARWAPRREVGL